MKRILIPLAAFALGSAFIAAFYLGLLSWLQGWEYASGQFARDRLYVLPLILGFGVQAALYSILRFQLFVPTGSTHHAGPMVGASGGTSATAMLACCLHHASDVVPILGLSAAATFLTRYQRPFMLVSLAMNIAGILFMLAILYRKKRKFQLIPEAQ